MLTEFEKEFIKFHSEFWKLQDKLDALIFMETQDLKMSDAEQELLYKLKLISKGFDVINEIL